MLSAAISQAQYLNSGWKPGSYYDLAGNKVSGLISWQPPGMGTTWGDDHIISFKKEKADKKIKISTYELKAFTVAADSFVVSNDTTLDENVLRVELNTPLKIYRLFQGYPGGPQQGPSTSSHYYYGVNPDYVTRLTRKNFMEVMENVLVDKPELWAQVKNKDLRYGDMEEIIQAYHEKPK
ncbi:hypothetical protein BC343_20875 [Mucilaginibacter pedocola]|uniref:Uncharacterized protein n=2 Tax=Mucilaginibacter pedocola TaxID=1792845 RepID=A0A1S9PKD2_9SPHI|nr:hypothetical protein BC343_20875 [Mucilaginibacter pedocola]